MHPVFAVARAPIDALSAKAKLLFKHASGRYHLRRVDAEGEFKVQPWFFLRDD